jgi:transposase
VQALQEISFKYRCQAIPQENEAIEKAKASNKNLKPIILTNDDNAKQLLASRLCFQYKNK